MSKFNSRVLFGTLLMCAAPQPLIAADFPDDMRGSYGWDTENDLESAVGFEAGLRYVYSYGNHSMTAAGLPYSIEDTSHILEGHLRIDDYSTATFLRASAGFNVKSSGNYIVGIAWPAAFEGGTVASLGGDFGWLPVGNDTVRAGLFIGYADRNESPDMGWTSAPGAHTHNALDIKALRLGLSARATFADTIDLSADVAAVPYAWLNGTYGAFSGGAAKIDGALYGVEGEVALGLHMTEQAIFRLGARGSYLAGQASLTEGGVTTSTSQLAFTRLGTFAELTYKF